MPCLSCRSATRTSRQRSCCARQRSSGSHHGTMRRVAGGILLVGIPTVVNTDSMILQMSRLTDQLTDVTRECATGTATLSWLTQRSPRS